MNTAEPTPGTLVSQTKFSRHLFILIFSLIVIAVSISALVSYQQYARQFRVHLENELRAGLQLKTGELENWRNDRLDDAALFYQNDNFNELVRNSFAAPQDAELRKRLTVWLTRTQAHLEYDRVSLLDVQGLERISVPNQPEAPSEQLKQAAAAALRSRQITFLDFHREPQNDFIRLSILVPLFAGADDADALGVLVFRFDPNLQVYARLKQWPITNVTVDTLLLRRDGNEILLLNDIGSGQNTALTLKLPLDQTDLLAVQAGLGATGLLEGLDQAGRPVIGVAMAVPASPWLLLAQMDANEMAASLWERIWQTVFFIGALSVIAGLGLYMLWRQQNLGYSRAQVAVLSALRESEAKYRLSEADLKNAQSIAHLGNWKWNVKTGEVTWSDEMFQIFGIDKSTYTGRLGNAISKVIHPDDLYLVLPSNAANIANQPIEYRIIMPDGSIRHIWARSGDTIFDEQGQPVFLTGVAQDISERKQVENSLEQARNRLAETQKIAQLGSFEYIAATQTTIWSEEEYRIYGLDPSGPSPAYDLMLEMCIHPDDAAMLNDNFMKALQIHSIYELEHRIVQPNGSVRWVYDRAQPYFNEQGEFVRYIGVTLDITERKQAEFALRNSEARFRSYFELPLTGSAITSPEKGWIDVNETLVNMLGYTSAEIRQMTWDEMTHPDDIAADLAQFNRIMAGEIDGYVLEKRFIHKDGHSLHIHMAVQCVRQPDRTVDYFVALLLDITERKQAEEALRKSETNLSALIENTDGSIWAVDKNYGLIVGNEQFHRIVSAALGHRLQMGESVLLPSFPPEANAEWRGYYDRALQGEHFAVETGTRFRDAPHYIEYRFSPIGEASAEIRGVTIFGRDITERKQSEQALRESEARFRALFHNLPMSGVIYRLLYDEHHEIVDWELQDINALGVADLQQAPEDLLGKRANDLFGAQVMRPYLELCREVVASGQSRQFETHFVTNDKYYLSAVFAMGTDFYANVSIDISERKRAEVALQASEERFRFMLNNSHEVVYRRNLQLDAYDYISPVMEQVLGWKAEEMMGMPVEEVLDSIHPDDFPQIVQEIERTNALCRTAGRATGVLEYRIRNKQGEFRWVGDTITVLPDAQGQPLYRQGIMRDITARKQMEDALLASEALYRSILIASPDDITLTDLQGRIRMVSPSALKIWGCEREEQLVGQLVGDFLVPEDLERAARDFQGMFDGRVLENDEYRGRRPDGSVFDFAVTGNFIRNAAGQPVSVLFIMRDITARKQMEDALRASEALYRSILDASPDDITLTDLEGRIRMVSPSALRMWHCEREDQLVGHLLSDFLVPEDLERAMTNIGKLLQGQRLGDDEYIGLRPDGSRFDFSVNGSFINNVDGQPISMLFVLRDMTEAKQTRAQLKRYSEHLEDLVEERARELHEAQEQLMRQERLAALGQMAASVGHELRNPLGVISNAVYYLKLSQPEASAKVREYLDIIQKETLTSDKIVTDLLDFTRIKIVEREPVPVLELLNQVLGRFPTPPTVQVTLDVPANLPPAFCDPRQLIQVLGNLTENACQAMPTGGKLTISAALQDGMIKLDVIDTGIGIAPENITKIFEPLFTTRNTGIGLGLAVSKKLLEANGGAIHVMSAPGQGTTFSLTLPVV